MIVQHQFNDNKAYQKLIICMKAEFYTKAMHLLNNMIILNN